MIARVAHGGKGAVADIRDVGGLAVMKHPML